MAVDIQAASTRPAHAFASRPDLQGMRAVAILTVFADHLFGWPTGGFIGVDVFFVLSGFFITGILISERTNTGKLSFQNFYIRRVRRILPSALLVLVVTVAGAYALFPAARAKETLLDALYAAVFASNFRFEAGGTDYFQQSQPPSPIQHYWSLSIEEQFYFVWPLLLVLLFAATRRKARRGHSWVRQWGLFGGMSVVVAASFGWAMYQSAMDPNAAFFSTFTRVWELGVGALLAIAGPWMARIPDAARPVLAYLGLAGVVVSLFVIDSATRWPAPWAVLPILSTALVVASFHGAPIRGMYVLTNPAARWFGDTSYTMYLWHWPVIILLLAVLPKGMLYYSIAIPIALALTAVTYHFYEDPIRKSGWLSEPKRARRERNGRRRRAMLTPSVWALTGALAAALIVVWILSFSYNEKIDAAQQERAFANNGRQLVDLSPEEKANPCFGALAMVTPGCALWNPDEPVRPNVDRLREDSQEAFACFREEGEPMESCTYGSTGPDATRIALMGDSHAAAILPAIWPSLNENNWQLTTFTGVGCRMDGPADECKTAFIETKRRLLAAPYDVLILTGARKGGGNRGTLVGSLEPIIAAGTRIIFISDTPSVGEDAMACLTRADVGVGKLGECGTSRAEGLALPDPMITAAGWIADSTLIDLTRFYCDDTRCPSVIGNVVAYYDSAAHLTGTYAKTLAPIVRDGIRAALHPVR